MQKYRIIRNESLKHHGILGMKWGKKNGPPYPLTPERHSASEKKAGWENSLSKNSPSMPSGGAGGGGGGDDEEDQKILKELYSELEEQARRLGKTPMELLNSQNFGLTLSEFTGKGKELKPSDLERLRQKAFNHYSRNSADLLSNTKKYTNSEIELHREKASGYVDDKGNAVSNKEYAKVNDIGKRGYMYSKDAGGFVSTKNDSENHTKYVWKNGKLVQEHTNATYKLDKKTGKVVQTNSDELVDPSKQKDKNNTYTLTDKGLVKEEDKSVWDKIKGKVLGETKVTYGEAKLEPKNDSEKNDIAKKDIKTGEKYTVTDKGLITDSEKTTWEKIKGKVFGETTVTFNDATIGKESINKESDTVLDKKTSDYKNDSKLKEMADSAKNWIDSTFKREPKKTMTIQDAMRIENEWRAKGLSDAEIDKKFMEEYGDYTVTSKSN